MQRRTGREAIRSLEVIPYAIVRPEHLRAIHVAFVLFLTFLIFPVTRSFRHRVMWWDWLFALAGIACTVYLIAGGDDFFDRSIVPNQWDIVFGVGPAGTGKTYLAMAQAVTALVAKKVSRIVLARPAVEAGEKLGFLPGDLQEKVNPYLRPLYDALFDMMDSEKAGRLIERGVIEVAPLAFMRGRTLNDAFVILDEAQNTTSEQMKMFLTRLGFGSKAVVTGDITQIDLPTARMSGLVEALKIVRDVEGIGFVYFDDKDVVRHKLVQQIVKAYEAFSNGSRSHG